MDRTLIIDLFSADGAGRALAGEWVRALPVMGGGFFRGGEHRELSAGVVQTIASNWAQREAIGLTRLAPINVEHVEWPAPWAA